MKLESPRNDGSQRSRQCIETILGWIFREFSRRSEKRTLEVASRESGFESTNLIGSGHLGCRNIHDTEDGVPLLYLACREMEEISHTRGVGGGSQEQQFQSDPSFYAMSWPDRSLDESG